VFPIPGSFDEFFVRFFDRPFGPFLGAVGIMIPLALIIVWFFSSADPDPRVEMWRRAEVVRICIDGSRIYRIDGVVGVADFARFKPLPTDVTPESLCR
jgi:hypothetical protein